MFELVIALLLLALVFLYISKKDKSKIIAWLFTLFCGAGMLLYAVMLYEDVILKQDNLLKFEFLSVILLSIYIPEVYEVFQKLPDCGNKTGTSVLIVRN